MPSQLASMTARDVALEVEGLGAAYTGYAESFMKQGFGGVVIAAYDKGGQLDKLFQDLSITNRLHRKVLRTHFHGLRIGSKQRAALEATTVQQSAPERMDDAPTAPPPSYSDAMHLGLSVADSPASDAFSPLFYAARAVGIEAGSSCENKGLSEAQRRNALEWLQTMGFEQQTAARVVESGKYDDIEAMVTALLDAGKQELPAPHPSGYWPPALPAPPAHVEAATTAAKGELSLSGDGVEVVGEATSAAAGALESEAAEGEAQQTAEATPASVGGEAAVENSWVHESLLHTACENDNISMLERLLEAAPNVQALLEARTAEGLPPLSVAAKQGSLRCVERLIAADARYRQAKQEEKAAAGPDECGVCLEPYGGDVHKCALVPCGHMLCIGCATSVPDCPICRKGVTSRLKLFSS